MSLWPGKEIHLPAPVLQRSAGRGGGQQGLSCGNHVGHKTLPPSLPCFYSQCLVPLPAANELSCSTRGADGSN